MIDQILAEVLSGATTAPSRSRQNRRPDPVEDLLGAILGAGKAKAQPSVTPSGRNGTQMGLIGDLIGTIMGAAGGRGGLKGSGSLIDLLGMVIGAATKPNRSGRVNPLVEMLARKLRINPVLAGLIVSFFVAKMIKGKARPAGLPENPRRKRRFEPGNPRQEEALDLDHLLEKAEDSEQLGGLIAQSGMDEELSKHAGIPQHTAREGLEIILSQLAKKRRKPKAIPKRQPNLKSLLDTWEC